MAEELSNISSTSDNVRLGPPSVSYAHTIEGYPIKLTNDEIKEEIDKLLVYANGKYYNPEIVIATNIMIQSGQNELNERFLRKTVIWNIILTLIAVLAAIISVIFSYTTNKTDKVWKDSELNVLNIIEKNTRK